MNGLQDQIPQEPPPPVSGVQRLDHIGLTVPNLDEAHRFFVEVLGCEYMYSLGPFHDEGSWMRRHLGVAETAVMRELHFFRLGGQAIFEIFEYQAPNQVLAPPLNSDVGGHHLAFYVSDLDSAVAQLHQHGITIMGTPTSSRGPSEGQRWVYFLAPWGLQCELVTYPEGKAYDRDPRHT